MLRFKSVNIVFLEALVVLLFFYWKFNFPVWPVVLLVLLYLAILVYGSAVVSAQFFTPIKCYGDASSAAIAITFDDGPLPDKTEKILKILKEQDVPAAFFCIGNRIGKNPELIRQIHQQGHIIGNHSFWHKPTFDFQTVQKISTELFSTDALVHENVGLKPRFFRPPYGITSPNLAKAVAQGGYISIGWSVRSFDTLIHDKTQLFNRVTGNLKGGDIILFHDYCDSTIEMLPDFLKYVSGLGLKIVRVDTLLNEKPYAG